MWGSIVCQVPLKWPGRRLWAGNTASVLMELTLQSVYKEDQWVDAQVTTGDCPEGREQDNVREELGDVSLTEWGVWVGPLRRWHLS